ncbi:30S ribosomal protein S21, chloroplastic, partial [Mucuna pruriens]
MAASSAINNFLSFFLPTKPPHPSPAPPPLQFNPATPLPSQTHKPPQQLIAQYDPSSSSLELSSVICPSLAYSNTLFFRSPYNVQVVVAEDEPEERLLNRFRREVLRAGVIQECRRRRYFENKQEEKKRKSREAAKRNRRRRPFSKTAAQNKQDVPLTKKEEAEDNWDLPEGDTVYSI